MKTKTSTLLFLALTFSCAFTFCCSNKSDDHCPGTNEKISLAYKDNYVPYQGNEQIKFLHNNTDTQIFTAQSKETYYVTEGISKEGECPKDYECVRVKFLNQTTNDIFTLAYERDKNVFSIHPSPGYLDNLYTFYKLSYKNNMYLTQLYDSDHTPIFINNIAYTGVLYIGADTTSNYIAYKVGKGVLRIRVNSENWDLIP